MTCGCRCVLLNCVLSKISFEVQKLWNYSMIIINYIHDTHLYSTYTHPINLQGSLEFIQLQKLIIPRDSCKRLLKPLQNLVFPTVAGSFNTGMWMHAGMIIKGKICKLFFFLHFLFHIFIVAMFACNTHYNVIQSNPLPSLNVTMTFTSVFWSKIVCRYPFSRIDAMIFTNV